MSHTTKGEASITDINALNAMVTELAGRGIKCRLEANVVPRMYSTWKKEGDRNQLKEAGYDRTHADYCLRLDDSPYDVAIMRNDDGTYTPVFDSWLNHTGKLVGANHKDHAQGAMSGQPGDIGLMMQLYGKHAAMNAATAQGHMVSGATVDASGHIHIEIQTR
jgi:hypothetical protein